MKYFIEPKTPDAADRVSMLLIELGIREDWSSGQEDTQGGKHDVCLIPGGLKDMKRIYGVELQDDRVRLNYFEREETSDARLQWADFLVKGKRGVIRRQANFRRAATDIDEIRALRARKLAE